MVNTYGIWTYEPNTPETKKCDCDRVADWIVSTGYQIQTSIENLTERLIAYAEEQHRSEVENWEFNLEDVINYVEMTGGLPNGLSEFDYEG